MRFAQFLALVVCAVAWQCLLSAASWATPRQDPELAFAQAACGGCHAVERYEASPNPKAPPFARLVNQPGHTKATLTAWLRDAHNYPEEMEFTLDEHEVDGLVSYMLSLRDTSYSPTN